MTIRGVCGIGGISQRQNARFAPVGYGHVGLPVCLRLHVKWAYNLFVLQPSRGRLGTRCI